MVRGVPPTEARPFFEYMNNGLAFLRTMLCVHFAVMALGDSNYPHFCRAGQQLDQRSTDSSVHPFIEKLQCFVQVARNRLELLT
jgi:sulfite reductase (NADPH) flavoprotein alpha-component